MIRQILAIAGALLLATPGQAAPVSIHVRNDAPAPLSGRLIVFARALQPADPLPEAVDASAFESRRTAITGREVARFPAGATAVIDGEIDSFPGPFSELPPGRYALQAVLDANHDYPMRPRGAGDIVSRVVEARLPGPLPMLALERVLPEPGTSRRLSGLSAEDRAQYEAALAAARPLDFVSPALSRFWGRPMHIRGWVALPPGYDPQRTTTYPVIYSTPGFGGSLATLRDSAALQIRRMQLGTTPPIIWVFLGYGLPTGPHEYVDSPNNGPWSTALAGELIPYLERTYRMDARPSGRFLTGHSSGGWTSLWLQLNHPRLFGGTWATSPDPVDFHAFQNVDLYRAENLYLAADGTPVPLAREGGSPVVTIRDAARIEAVLGGFGGQVMAFESVFSPRGADGRPMPLFDRATGRIDPEVAAHWREHYDLAGLVEREWPRIGADLTGKIHVVVGTADTFYLDIPVRRFQAVLDRLGGRASFAYLEGKTHFDLYNRGDDWNVLYTDIAWAVYAVARPDVRRPH